MKSVRMMPWAAAVAAGMLVGCDGEQIAQSGDAFSAAADVHDDPQIIENTEEIDSIIVDMNADGGFTRKVFETETVLMEREADPGAPDAEAASDRKAYFGDLHVHTTYSFDGHSMGTLATPYDAYRFALGEAIANPAGFDMQLSAPLDFYSVTDHAMFLGLFNAASDTSTAFSRNTFAEPYRDFNAAEKNGTDIVSTLRRLATFASFLPTASGMIAAGELDREEALGIIRGTWADIVEAADQYNDPGKFTTFVGFEYTTSTPDMGNLHRNVIFEGSERLPREPFSRFHSTNPEDLWDWMDELRDMGVESLAIPHNSNASNGQMFKMVDWAGNPMDDAYATQRLRNEPIVEITQIKGTSETHPQLSSRDEFAGFEILPYRVATNALSQIEGSYVREALRTGLTLEEQGIANPYMFGFIGSSDTHSAASQLDESTYVSKLGLLSALPEQRGSVPRQGLDGEFSYWFTKAAMTLVPSPQGKGMFTRINGDVYARGSSPLYGASGLAAVWAEENTRESIYRAFRRKEVFATSGPRISLRFFAGYDLDDSMLESAEAVQRAYTTGVSMGGELAAPSGLEAEPQSPGFIVMASADPRGAPLQRLQVIKGWIDAQGTTHEQVVDVACAGGAAVDLVTQRCPDNGARVDVSDCSINVETGASQLAVLWHDPDFQPGQRAFYYARALENPTCRWSTWDAIRAGVDPRPDLARTLQERAWSSPIHFLGAQ
ncbi:DUF3604 domain-containing protein [Halioglobus japonicus]|uniref:DUF3604 domain-containing protein n=1 Tax=Halioglobus japonicus TaxID=930805 RepID=A0AAP8SPL1_9GAMM|nr:DUF3604 domain-containing protein [Halioglobus japonicus]PLW87706.1 DUF3604 domain-containing protein [Halioglobus japonicus]